EIKHIKDALDRIFHLIPMEESTRIIRTTAINEPALILINDYKIEQITIMAYLPTLERADIGHLFATGDQHAFRMDDVHVDPIYQDSAIGSKMMEQLIQIAQRHHATRIWGQFSRPEDDRDKWVHFLRKFGYTVSVEAGGKMNIELVL
ncbi:MAG TPA: GNAT family N-acetyltransferase, partial [Puia sp.]